MVTAMHSKPIDTPAVMWKSLDLGPVRYWQLLASGLTLFVLYCIVRMAGSTTRDMLEIPIAVAAGVVGLATVTASVRSLILTQRLRVAVKAHQGRVCPDCGYVHGSSDLAVQCPECGARINAATVKAQWARVFRVTEW